MLADDYLKSNGKAKKPVRDSDILYDIAFSDIYLLLFQTLTMEGETSFSSKVDQNSGNATQGQGPARFTRSHGRRGSNGEPKSALS